MVTDKKGFLLLQTIVIIIIIAMLSVFAIRWVHSRYILTAKVIKSIDAKGLVWACRSMKEVEWSATAISAGTSSCTIDGVTVNVSVSADPNITGGWIVTYTVDYDTLAVK